MAYDMKMSGSGIRIERVGKTFGNRAGSGSCVAIDDISLAVRAQEFVTVLGPSGCGKSTLLRIVAGLEPQTSGTVFLNDREIVGPGSERGMVFQAYSLFPWLTVEQNVAYGLDVKHVDPQRRRSLVETYLKATGLFPFRAAFPRTLSGGMRQRVAIARSLINEPEVLLLDEPFGALDTQTRSLMQEFLLGIWERDSRTVMFVTHDIDEAIFLADRVVVMRARPGRIRAIVPIDLPRPRLPPMRLDPQFTGIKAQLVDWIRVESMAAMELEDVPRAG